MSSEASPGPICALTTERLVLRPLAASDAEDVYEYASNPDVTRFVRFETHASKDATRAYLEKTTREKPYVWGITLREGGKLIGSCGFVEISSEHRRAELGYVVNPKFRGQGFVPEAVRAVVRFGFEHLNFNRIQAITDPANKASIRVLEKCGFKFEGALRNYEFIKGRFMDSNMFSILRNEVIR
jgi:ribosomal-protein-alanine N-acetyltransferase